MVRVRPFVVLLMSLAVCLQGHASVRVMDASCPMRQAHVMHHMPDHAGHVDSNAHMPVHDHGHAHEQGTVQQPAGNAHDGSTHDCGSHLGCDPVSAGMATAQVFPVFRQPIMPAAAGVTPAFHSYNAFLLWRPPARS